MDPYEVREERVVSGAQPVVPPAAPVAPVAPVPATPVAPVAPVAAAPVAPVAAAPVAGTSVYSSRTGVYPAGYRAIQAVWLVIGIINIVLALDFVFRAAGFVSTGFYHFIYSLGSRLSAPFDGIFGTQLNSGQSQLRWADLVAIAIYSIVGWIITKVIRIATTPRSGVTTY